MELTYAVDIARGWAPLVFDRDANPNGHEPVVLTDAGGQFIRLSVQAGAYAGAARGEPDRCDRCELRDGKVPMRNEAWHGFALRLAPGFPVVPARFVAAQVKAEGGASPLIAIRVANGRLYADFRVAGATVELPDALPAGGWTDIVIGFVADRAELWVDGRHKASARADFAAAAPTRYLKIGPYRDKVACWGAEPAGIDVRDIRRGDTRAAVKRPAERLVLAA